MSQLDRKTFADFLTQQLQEIAKPFARVGHYELREMKDALDSMAAHAFQGMTAAQAREMKMDGVPEPVPDHAWLVHDGVSCGSQTLEDNVFRAKLVFKNPRWIVSFPTAAQVWELRKITGAGVMHCREALLKNQCDPAAAARWLRRHPCYATYAGQGS